MKLVSTNFATTTDLNQNLVIVISAGWTVPSISRGAPGVRDAGRGVQHPPAVSGAGEETEGRDIKP